MTESYSIPPQMMLLWGGVDNANILMFSDTGYQLYGEEDEDGQMNYFTFEYDSTETYNNKEYFKYSYGYSFYILAPTRNITKVIFPFNDYFINMGQGIVDFSSMGYDSLYGFTSVPENKVVMKRRTDIGTNANGKDCVDLGLTSGTLWAKCNVGAKSETDYGSYFQWGDTEDKRNADCSWSTYKYGDGSNFSKYNTGLNGYGGTIDNKLTLDLEDDAARVNMEGDWRMPTAALIEELSKETTKKWTTINGVNGCKFTGSNGNSIFIPAAGFRSGSSFRSRGDRGYVWGSSLNSANPCYTWDLRFIVGPGFPGNDNNRPIGFVVRGVL